MTPYEQGKKAYWNGASLNANPYPTRDNDHRDWANGWWAAQDDHQKMKGGE
jgi:ribosome modulation factor